MKHRLASNSILCSGLFIAVLLILSACSASDTTTPPAAALPTETTSATSIATEQPTRAASPTAARTPIVIDRTYAGSLDLIVVAPRNAPCGQTSPFDLPREGLQPVAYVATGVCFNGEIGLMEIDQRLYVVQSAGTSGAFIITDVTDPTDPDLIGVWRWRQNTYTADVKPFHQGDRWYLALSMEGDQSGNRPSVFPCGIAIVEVTDPSAPELVTLLNGKAVEASKPWCNVHTSEIDFDASGDGAYIMVSSDDTYDLRVVDIRDLDQPREVNAYTYPDIPVFQIGLPGIFVHDSTITADRVYISYWDAGVVILDKQKLLAGESPDVVVLNPLNSIDPLGFEVHHSFATPDGNYLFIEDEINYHPPYSQLRLFDIRDVRNPEEVMEIALDEPLTSPHNLLIQDDLLFVGWYKDGVRVYRYDVSDAAQVSVEPVAFQAVRDEEPPQGLLSFNDFFDGIYGVRLHDCNIDGRATTCIYASDLTMGLLIMELDL